MTEDVGDDAPIGTISDALRHAEQLLTRDPGLALRQAVAILEAAPDHPQAQFVLGAAHLRLGDHDAARDVLGPLATSQPRAPAVQLEWGLLLAAGGDIDGAIAALERAVALRPDLASSQQNVLSFQWNFRAAKLGLFPTLNLDGSYGINSSSPGGGQFRNSSSIGLDLAVPIYDRGATRAETAQAQGQLDNAVAQLVAEQESVQLSVQQALVNLVASYAALSQTNVELAKAQDVLRSTQAQYKAGVTTLPLLLNAQVGLTQALTDEVSAVYTVRQSEQALLYAEGANAAG